MSRMSFLLIGFSLILVSEISAQVNSPLISFPDSIAQAIPEWVDADNDGLLDVVIFMKTNSSHSYVSIVPGDTINPLTEIKKTFPVPDYEGYILADYNHDNAMDIIVSGEENGILLTSIYLNKGGFNFEKTTSLLPPFTQGRFVDLDNDAVPELVITGEDISGFYTKILQQQSESSWKTVHDSLKIKCSDMEIIDADGDGDFDLFVSGHVGTDSLVSGFLINNGNFYMKPTHILPLAGNSSAGDLDSDGFFDVVLMAADRNGVQYTKEYRHSSSGYVSRDLSLILKNGIPFIADLNYDGVADIHFYGTNASGDTVSIIQYRDGENEVHASDQLTALRFGDPGHTGNLDLISVSRQSSLILALSAGAHKKKNEGPKRPGHAVALPVFNRVFMYWDKPGDDHTATASLTFDLHLGGYQSGDFDLLNDKRLTVSHGNNGTQNFRLLKNIGTTDLKFAIQAVDNSFHAGEPCIGNGTDVCAGVETEEIFACTMERVVLASPAGALWFSFRDGFLGSGSDFEFSANMGDTLFYYNPVTTGCSSLKAWAININDNVVKTESSEKYGCEGAILELDTESGWEHVSWSSQRKGDLGSASGIQYTVSGADSVFVTMRNSLGCEIIRKTAIKISKPEVTVSADHFRIMKGGDVQLGAAGAQRYVWTPILGLNDFDISNPVASPTSSIQYTVTGFDSLDCTGQAAVTINVEETGFIPNLFSPNDDGQNDQLKIYGVVSAQRFTFSVYNREGALVYKTSDVSEAVQRGWDGTKNGTKQPPGVYFWRVKGENSTGQLLLNGKDSGSIVLIR